MQHTHPIARDLVLVGGGHSHIIVLRMLAMNPVPGLRVSLISPDVYTPYSGMLPGLIAGHYAFDDIHIDLVPLCRFAASQFVKARVNKIDPFLKQVYCDNRPAIDYDVLSIDIGITPELGDLEKRKGEIIPVKPINEFLKHWQAFLQRFESGEVNNIGIVGAGAAGVELCLSIQYRLKEEYGRTPRIDLYTKDSTILGDYPDSVQKRLLGKLKSAGVDIHTGFKVSDIRSGELISTGGLVERADEIFWVTAAAAQNWLTHSGLALDDKGFIKVRDTLQVQDYDEIFAVGDIAHIVSRPLPKAGVYAVRQGPVLERNIRRFLLGKQPGNFKPQNQFLSLIATGGKYAVASRNGFSMEGRLIWQWKNWIDRRFMNRFRNYPVMDEAKTDGLLDDFDNQMQCGGCGSKVSPDILTEELKEIGLSYDHLDDAAVYEVPDGKVILHTLDAFKSFVDDPYLFAQIAVHHALSDIYAMGGEPVTALAIITAPYGKPSKIKAQLRQLMSGAKSVLDREGVELTGGHTTEGSELTIGFSVNGIAVKNELMKRDGLNEGDCLILTKPIGTGIIFAADMQSKARGLWVESALESMNQSNRQAADIFRRAGVVSCTDITGFGLAGHLLEMLRASEKKAVLRLDQLPILDGAREILEKFGIKSTLHDGNQRSAKEVERSIHGSYSFLFDPQTSGGLLAAVPEVFVDETINKLSASGYEKAVVVGRIVRGEAAISFE